MSWGDVVGILVSTMSLGGALLTVFRIVELIRAPWLVIAPLLAAFPATVIAAFIDIWWHKRG